MSEKISGEWIYLPSLDPKSRIFYFFVFLASNYLSVNTLEFQRIFILMKVKFDTEKIKKYFYENTGTFVLEVLYCGHTKKKGNKNCVTFYGKAVSHLYIVVTLWYP